VVNRQTQAVILLLVGGAVLRASLTHQYLNYVKPGLHVFLIAAGVILVCAGAYALWFELRPTAAHVHDDGHGHSHKGPAVAWLMLLPALALLLVAPPALGSYAAGRTGTAVAAPSDFAPLPAGDPVQISMLDYAARAVFDQGHSLGDRRVRLTGFAMPGPDGTWILTRMIVTCCAADARPIKVALDGDLPTDITDEQWLDVVGTYDQRLLKDPVNGESIPFIHVTEAAKIRPPTEQYES
jgi:uncharacterized repeat protein (TIGR03943 family)